MLLIEAGNDNLSDNARRGSIFRADIVSAEEIMLIDRLCAREPVRANCQLDSFEYCCLTGVVVTKQDGRTVEVQIGEPYSAKILDVDANDAHKASPRIPRLTPMESNSIPDSACLVVVSVSDCPRSNLPNKDAPPI